MGLFYCSIIKAFLKVLNIKGFKKTGIRRLHSSYPLRRILAPTSPDLRIPLFISIKKMETAEMLINYLTKGR